MAGDDIDPFLITGNLAVERHPDDPAEFGDGSVDIDGNINLDGTIGENTLSNGFNIKDLKYTTLKQITPPSLPVSSEHTFFYDTSDSLFKSIDSSGVVTTYQPTNQKGDLLSHNGTTQIRFPVGSDNQFIVADSSQPSGLKWTNQVIIDAGEAISTIKHHFTLLGALNFCSISLDLIGAFYNPVYNERSKGPSANFFVTKSRQSIDSDIVRLNSNPAITTLEQLESQWIKNEEIEITKDGSGYDGDYVNTLLRSNPPNTIQLTGTAFTQISPNTTGNFYFSMYSENEGAAGIFLASKNNSTYNNGSIFRINNSPSPSNAQLKVRWPASSGIEIQKSDSNNDGLYKFYNLITEYADNSLLTVALSGTSPITISNRHQRLTAVVSITSSVINAPFAIFSVSKNDKTRTYSVVRVASSPGTTTNEQLHLIWNIDDKLKLYKNGAGYDGNYDIVIIS